MKVILLMAITLDGKIGKDSDHFPDWTGKEDKKLFVEITKRVGAMIIGSKTYKTIGKPLPNRKNIIMTRDKSRKSEWDNLIFTDQTPVDILADLENDGYSEVILAGGTLVNSLFARAHLIDEIIVTISPKIFGVGISLFDPEIAMDLELEEVKPLGIDLIYAKYKVKKSESD
jgi:dihydrofolate reductase